MYALQMADIQVLTDVKGFSWAQPAYKREQCDFGKKSALIRLLWFNNLIYTVQNIFSFFFSFSFFQYFSSHKCNFEKI